MKTYRLKIANVNKGISEHHSVRVCNSEHEALSYFWAMRRVIFPQRVWILRGHDGWISNDSTVGKEPPAHLSTEVARMVAEDNETALDGIASNEKHLAA